MKNFRAEAVIVRKVKGLTIVFLSKDTIYVKADDTPWAIFHRWGAPRGSYSGGWKQMRHRFGRKSDLTYADCFKIARRWNIPFVTTTNPPDLSKVKVDIRIEMGEYRVHDWDNKWYAERLERPGVWKMLAGCDSREEAEAIVAEESSKLLNNNIKEVK